MALHYVEAGKILDRMSAAGAKPFSLKKMLYSNPEKKVSLGVVFALISETLKCTFPSFPLPFLRSGWCISEPIARVEELSVTVCSSSNSSRFLTLAVLNCLARVDKRVLDELLDHSGIMKNKELHGKGHILHVMLYDLLFGKSKSISGGGALKKLITSWSTRLQAELVKMKVKYKIRDFAELIPEHLRQPVVLPRWVRVNHLLSDLSLAKSFFEKEGWVEIPFEAFFKQLDEMQALQAGGGSSETSQKTGKKMAKVFCMDRDLSDLLAFPPLTDFHEHSLLLSGHIVLQDKASALSGAALQVPASEESFAMDACAAPGQKTSQVAQSMKNLGKLFAFDLDQLRLDTLKRLCKRNGLKNLTAVHGSFLEIDVNSEPYCNVEYILLDPSCSGSGIVNRLDYFLSSSSGTEHDVSTTDGDASAVDVDVKQKKKKKKSNKDAGGDDNEEAAKKEMTPAEAEKKQLKERVLKLQEFQLSLIKKAMSFPRLKQLVYSTCSIHDEENEQVVEKASKFSDAFQVARVLPLVPMRGLSSYPHGEMCVRTVPSRDHTIGFFVSMFERKPSHALPPRSSSSSSSSSSVIASKSNLKKRKEPEPEHEETKTSSSVEMEVDPSTPITSKASPSSSSSTCSSSSKTATSTTHRAIAPEEESRPTKSAKLADSSTPLDPVPAKISSSSSLTSTSTHTQPKNKNKNKHRPSSKPLVR